MLVIKDVFDYVINNYAMLLLGVIAIRAFILYIHLSGVIAVYLKDFNALQSLLRETLIEVEDPIVRRTLSARIHSVTCSLAMNKHPPYSVRAMLKLFKDFELHKKLIDDGVRITDKQDAQV